MPRPAAPRPRPRPRLAPLAGLAFLALALPGCLGPGFVPGSARGSVLRVDPPSVLWGSDPAPCAARALADAEGQPFTALADHALPGPLRVLRPEQGVTRDRDPTRLNAQVDGAGRILRLFCG